MTVPPGFRGFNSLLRLESQSQPTPDERPSVDRPHRDREWWGFTWIRGRAPEAWDQFSHQTVKKMLKEHGFDHLDETVTFASLRKTAVITKSSRSF